MNWCSVFFFTQKLTSNYNQLTILYMYSQSHTVASLHIENWINTFMWIRMKKKEKKKYLPIGVWCSFLLLRLSAKCLFLFRRNGEFDRKILMHINWTSVFFLLFARSQSVKYIKNKQTIDVLFFYVVRSRRGVKSDIKHKMYVEFTQFIRYFTANIEYIFLAFAPVYMKLL